MWNSHTKAKSLNEMKTLLISGHQCCICTSIWLKPHHTFNEIFPDDQHKKVKDIWGSITLRKVLSSAFNFPHETSTLTNLQTILTKAVIHISSHCLQHSLSFMHEKKTFKGKTLQNIPVLMYLEGNKSYWTMHIICWKVQARELIIITAFNTELPVLLFEGVSAGRPTGMAGGAADSGIPHPAAAAGLPQPSTLQQPPSKYRLSCCLGSNGFVLISQTVLQLTSSCLITLSAKKLHPISSWQSCLNCSFHGSDLFPFVSQTHQCCRMCAR